MQSWSRGKSEIEIVDFLIVLNERLQFIDRYACLFGAANESRRVQLQTHYDTLLQLLPTDLRASILRNGSRAAAARPSSAETDPEIDADAEVDATVVAQTVQANAVEGERTVLEQDADALAGVDTDTVR